MWVGVADRKILLDIVSSKNPSHLINLRSTMNLDTCLLDGHELLLVWEEEPGIGTVLPAVICVAEGRINEFLAWVTTYLPSFCPFTSYCRILDSQIVDCFKKNEHCASLKSIEGAVVGAIIGESISHYENQDLKRITPTSIMSTYSFAMASACAHGIIRRGYNPVRERWERSRKVTQQSQRRLSVGELDKVWDILTLLGEESTTPSERSSQPDVLKTISKACQDLSAKASIGRQTWADLTGDLPMLRKAALWEGERREQRVVWFEEAVGSIQRASGLDETLAAFLCGYLASQIAPGCMKHVELLRRCMRRYPSVIVWYGLCAGLYEKTDVYNHDNGLGWRIRRDMLKREVLYSEPKGDIALEELEILLGVEHHEIEFRTASHSHIVVEILPRVYTVVIWPAVGDKAEWPLASVEKTRVKPSDPMTLLGEAIDHTKALYRDAIDYLHANQKSLGTKEKAVSIRKYSRSKRHGQKPDTGDQPTLNLKQ